MTQHDAANGLILRSAMDPHAIEDDVVRDALLGANQVVDRGWRVGASDFQTDQPVVVCSRLKDDGAGTASSGELNLGQHVFWGSAWEGRPGGKGGDSGITRSQTSTFGRKFCVGDAGSNDDPVRVIAFLCGQEQIAESDARLKLDGIAAGCFGDGAREIFARPHHHGLARRRSRAQIALNVYPRKLGWPIKTTGMWGRLRSAGLWRGRC